MRKVLTVLLFLIFSFGANAQDIRLFTIWNKNQITVEPWEKVVLKVAEKIHYSPKQNNIQYTYGEFFVGHEAKNWLEYGGGLRVAFTNLALDNWLNENRGMLYLNLSQDIKTFDLSFSNRLEYRTFKELDNYFRYKQSLKLNFPNLTAWGMQFYIAEESFCKINQDVGTHLARLYTGLNAIDKNNFQVKIYYGLEKANLLDSWITGDILGVNLNFTI